MSRSSNLVMRSVFHPRRWTCHVPRAKAVMGIRAALGSLAAVCRMAQAALQSLVGVIAHLG